LSTDLDHEWPIWRLVIKQIATLTELENTWSYLDVLAANAVLDMEKDYEYAISGLREKT